ncbi:MAG: efflux RND transporter permease subunit [Bacteroidales bacterium]|jgi:multidrug efflux pump subunit AcrB|nr:efflux RND transporter permease subunit [Bacteroidales bacterium]
MQKNNRIIEWAMKNRQIIILLVAVLFAGGIYSLVEMPKQEMPEYTIRKGLVVGVYPGANSAQVEEQLTKPLERYLFTFPEIKRKTTASKTEDGIVYIFVDLADDVKDNNIVWSKIKHGLASFKSTLPSGVLAVAVNDNFGDVSAILVAMESDDKTSREIDNYCDALEDRLRAVPDVANVRRYGSQKEQITIYVDNEKLSAYGVGAKTLTTNLFAQGFTTAGGSLENSQSLTPIHIAETFRTEQEIASQIIFSTPQGDVVRVKDIGNVVREYPTPDSYITHNARKCVLLSIEVNPKANIITFGKEVNQVLTQFKNELPESVNINRIADQPEIVSHSITTFLRELLIAIFAVVLVIIILLPFRVATVSAMSIPITITITFVVMHAVGIPLNFVTLAALMAVLGIIVDDTIVVVDNYIDKLDAGISRWNATIQSVQEYFKSILSATLAISITFIPILFTSTGNMRDMIRHFPWTICIALFSSLLVGVLVIPIIQYFFIKRGLHKSTVSPAKKRRSFLDTVQSAYEKVLAKTFAFPKTTLLIALASIIAGVFMFLSVPIRMMPVAERDQFAVEIYLPNGSPLAKTAAIADSMENILRKDSRVKSVSAFMGTSSPRFHIVYAPHVPSKAYAQFIVNTVSNRATEKLLDEYTNKYAFYFPEAYVHFKQLDFQTTDAPLEIRLASDNISDLKTEAEKIETYLRGLDECLWVRTSFETPVQSAKIELSPEETARLGINKALVSAGISSGLTGMKISDVWEGSYSVPVYIEPQKAIRHSPEDGNPPIEGHTVSDLENVQVSGLLGSSVPLRQIAEISSEWNEGAITHRSGIRTISVFADIKRGENVNKVLNKIFDYTDGVLLPQLPEGMTLEYGGNSEQDKEVFVPLIFGMIIAFTIMFFILVFHFRKLKLAVIVMSSAALCVFGAAFGVWITNIDFNAFAVLGIIGLVGIIVRNGIIMFDYIEYLRFKKNENVKQAAFGGGKRRMRPIFLTSAVAAMGVLPMIISQSPMWAPMATIIFFGTLITMTLIVTVLPVVYWLAYKKHDKIKVSITN